MKNPDKNYPIIVVPGVFDSELYFDKELTKLAWPPKGLAQTFDLLRSGGLEKLEHEYAGATLYVHEPTDNSVAEHPVYGMNNKWEKISKALMAAFPDRHVWFFPFDFRQLSTTTMVRFAEFLKQFDTPVDIVCHSYGNNLVATYLTNYGPDKIHRAACLAPPFRGSAEIFLVPAGSAYMPCMGELAPTPALNKIYPVYLKRSADAQPEIVDETTYNEILVKFFGSGAVDVDYSGILSHPGCHFGVGIDLLTPTSTTFTLDENQMPYVSDFEISYQGDGTVIMQSEELHDQLSDKTTYFPGVAHSRFEFTDAVIYWTIMQINSGEPPIRHPEIVRKPYIKFLISGSADVHIRKPFSVKDMVSALEPTGATLDYLVIGKDRNMALASIEPQDCVVDLYSLKKRENLRVTIQFFDEDGKVTSTRHEEVSGRYIRFTVSADGTVSKPFVLDIPPIVSNEGSKLTSDLLKAVSGLTEGLFKDTGDMEKDLEDDADAEEEAAKEAQEMAKDEGADSPDSTDE